MSGLPDPASKAGLRDQLSKLRALLALSMVMTESSDEAGIVELACTAVGALGDYRVAGVHLTDGGWQECRTPLPEPDSRADLEAQFAVLGSAGGVIAMVGEDWTWAYPLRSLEDDLGYLIVSADDEPQVAHQFLLRVLAQQTGIAVNNARVHERQRAGAEQLRTTNTKLAETVTALERSTAIHDRLTRAAVGGDGMAGIAEVLHDLTGLPVAVEDRRGNLQAWAGPGPPHPYPKESATSRERLFEHMHERQTPVRHQGRLVAVAGPREAALGVLALIDPDETAGAQEQVALEHAATVLSVELAHLQNLAETESRLGRDLVEELLSGADEATALARAQALGHDLNAFHRVVVIDRPGGVRNIDALCRAVQRVARVSRPDPLLAGRGREVVLLAGADEDWSRFRAAVEEEAGIVGCRVGVGGSCARPGEISRSYGQARLALRIQTAAGGRPVSEFDRLGVYQLLAESGAPGAMERFVDGWLGSLLEYDARRNADLVNTLGTFLESGGGYDPTASALSIHRSTLKYRLQRIREISGHDLSDPDTLFNLQFATRAWRTLAALRHGDH
ncbi:PucR family transcriptional regulator [Actinomadura barringtoniae]|nr:helix-turn-helix domain-containing protein [Actinomadura barringtoniae]